MIDETGKTFSGVVEAVGAAVDPVSKTLPVRV
ncbi:efflux RND transporter periplasmic adaptor subunit [Desulfovibrio sp. JC022]|nr:efflux RND transporter periplasmic adaptor subunit [Desulfovibrio sp. JC022]NDV24269.1 efflux RND transporter periplasmic adaptor subunit [Desulfovibrio sp. JC022]